MNVPNLRDANSIVGTPKDVESTPMLNTTAHETVDMTESNAVGKELVNSDSIGGVTLGLKGRN